MFGSLDCTHTYWKNCAKGWMGSYSGKEHKPSIVLEAIVDHHTFFRTPFMVMLVQEGRFTAWQESARKDVERAFSILRSQWKFVEHKIYLIDLTKISSRMNTHLILHYILVTDRS
ncbi:hypothetical protein ACHAW6_010035 [Cyclotella cf. meneghiniana]